MRCTVGLMRVRAPYSSFKEALFGLSLFDIVPPSGCFRLLTTN